MIFGFDTEKYNERNEPPSKISAPRLEIEVHIFRRFAQTIRKILE